MINCHLFRLASTRSKCSWHTRMSLCSSEFITPLLCHLCNNAQILSLDIFTTISRDGEIIECFKRTREVGAIAQVKTFSTIMYSRLSIGEEIMRAKRVKIDKNGKSQKTYSSKDRFFMFLYVSFNPGLQALSRINL